MVYFYAKPQTNQKLTQFREGPVVFLVGGYSGYYFNFGDLLQLKGCYY